MSGVPAVSSRAEPSALHVAVTDVLSASLVLSEQDRNRKAGPSGPSTIIDALPQMGSKVEDCREA